MTNSGLDYEAIKDTASILDDANLASISPEIFALGQQLKVINFALHSMMDSKYDGNPSAVVVGEVRHNFLDKNGVQGILKYAEIVMRKIAEDEALSRLIHDRTCNECMYLSAFSPEAEGRITSNIVKEIDETSKKLTGLMEVIGSKRIDSDLPGSETSQADMQRIGNATRDLSMLKKNLQQAAMEKK